MYDVVALGELLIDFTPLEMSPTGNTCFEENPGGAPANVLSVLSNFGSTVAFIGKVGDDPFGHHLYQALVSNGIDPMGLVFADRVPTTLAFVHLQSDGERSFTFYRNPGADATLSPEEIDLNLIRCTKIFHFGSVSMSQEPVKSATLCAIETACNSGCIISYDPNIRLPLWKDINACKDTVLDAMRFAHILKLSEEELQFLVGQRSLEEGTQYLHQMYGIPLILITLGYKGCFYRFNQVTGQIPSFSVKTIDTTGAGDAFVGAILYRIIQRGATFDGLKETELSNIVRFANAVGALTTTRRGAMSGLPTYAETLAFLERAISY